MLIYWGQCLVIIAFHYLFKPEYSQKNRKRYIWLTALILVFKRNNISLGFFGSSLLAMISYLLLKNFIVQLSIYVIGGIIFSLILSKYRKKRRRKFGK